MRLSGNCSLQHLFNTEEAKTFIIPETGFSAERPFYLSAQLLSSFESGDNRRHGKNWIDSITIDGTVFYYPYKYKLDQQDPSILTPAEIDEYLMVFRIAEQYLIRAEARAQQNNVAGAQNDLNIIRSRAGLANTNAGDLTSLTDAVLHERQTEMFTEWGHRWLDLKRTDKVDEVMSAVTST